MTTVSDNVHVVIFKIVILVPNNISISQTFTYHSYQLYKCMRVLTVFWKTSQGLKSLPKHIESCLWVAMRRYTRGNIRTCMSLIYVHCTKSLIPMNNVDPRQWKLHYNDVIMSMVASQITSFTIVYSSIYSGANQREYQNSASLAVVRGIHRWPVNSSHKGSVTRKMLPFDDVIMNYDFLKFLQGMHVRYSGSVAWFCTPWDDKRTIAMHTNCRLYTISWTSVPYW